MSLITTFARMLDARGIPFTWDGDPYLGIRTSCRQTRDAMPEGLRERYAFSLIVPYQDPEPNPDDLVTVGGVAYRVWRVDTDALAVSQTIHLHEG